VHKSSSHKNHFSCRRNSPMSLSGWRILAGRLVIPSVMKLSIYRHFFRCTQVYWRLSPF